MRSRVIEHYLVHSGCTRSINCDDVQRGLLEACSNALATGNHRIALNGYHFVVEAIRYRSSQFEGAHVGVLRNWRLVAIFTLSLRHETAPRLWKEFESFYLQSTDRGQLAKGDWQSPKIPEGSPWVASFPIECTELEGRFVREFVAAWATAFINICQLGNEQMGLGTTTQQPTPEMIAHFETRTRDHIRRVGRLLSLLASLNRYSEYGPQLRERAKTHDASKFTPMERIPYVWLTEFHRCLHHGIAFTYPDGIKERVEAAITHHASSNRHHPQFHDHPDDMTDVDIMEMVCDWTALAEEINPLEISARRWADTKIGKSLRFNERRRRLVYEVIDALDEALRPAEPVAT
jgi:hypothetical protein